MNRLRPAQGPGLDPDRVAHELAAVVEAASLLIASSADRAAGRIEKADGTPTTDADLAAERLILDRLAAAFPEIPVVAEESSRSHAGELFFLVDPLDGTKDFLAGDGEWSVNVALVAGTRPVAAALAVQALDRIWAAGTGAWVRTLGRARVENPVEVARARAVPGEGPLALVSRRHEGLDDRRCLEETGVRRRRTVSSAAKFGLLASGEADLYVRCGPTMEWDTAAGDHILTRAGGCVIGPDGAPLRYGGRERGYRNGPFAALGDPALARRIRLPAAGDR